AEKQTLGFDHTEIASSVCEMWNIPKHINAAIRYHHNPASSPEKELAHVIYTADCLAKRSGFGGAGVGATLTFDEHAGDFFELQESDFESLVGSVTEYVENTMSQT
ncbi:MAG: HDOD domain-containing protein, partial [Deltaproteobacteria bacterium]|nr:HDOD domain-containing protein [Deltaproteobacteria bacterium]